MIELFKGYRVRMDDLFMLDEYTKLTGLRFHCIILRVKYLQ